MNWPWKRNKPKSPWRPEFEVLARYNSEKSRGITHTEEWKAQMAVLQREFNVAYSRPPAAGSDGLPTSL